METIRNMHDSTIKGLQNLIEINIDSAKGFEQAASTINEPRLNTLFRETGAQRAAFAVELKRFVASSGEKPEDDGSAKAALHRWWLNVRGSIKDDNAHSVLSEAERGEDAIKARYEEVLKDNPGTPVSDVLHRQYASVKAAHDRIRDMRDATA